MTPDQRAAAIRSVDSIDDLLATLRQGIENFPEAMTEMQRHLRALRTFINIDPTTDDAVDQAHHNLLLACRRWRAVRRYDSDPSEVELAAKVVSDASEILDAAIQTAAVAGPRKADGEVSATEANLRMVLSVCEAYLEHTTDCPNCESGAFEACAERKVLWTIAYEALPTDLEPYDVTSRKPMTGQPAR